MEACQAGCALGAHGWPATWVAQTWRGVGVLACPGALEERPLVVGSRWRLVEEAWARRAVRLSGRGRAGRQGAAAAVVGSWGHRGTAGTLGWRWGVEGDLQGRRS